MAMVCVLLTVHKLSILCASDWGDNVMVFGEDDDKKEEEPKPPVPPRPNRVCHYSISLCINNVRRHLSCKLGTTTKSIEKIY